VRKFSLIATATALATALALAAAPAGAAPPWSAPQDISATHQFVDRPAIAFTGNGAALASWAWQDGTHRNAAAGASVAARQPRQATFGPELRLGLPGRVGRAPTHVGIAATGAARTVLAQIRHVRLDPLRADADRLEVASGTTNGAFGPRRAIAVGPQMLRATLASNLRGDAVIAWWERGRGSSRLFASVRRAAAGAFGAPVRLACRGFGDVAVAVSPGRGDVLVAWASGGVVRVRSRLAGSARFGPARRVSRAPAPQADVEAALAPSGRAAVAWASQSVTEGGTTGPIRYSGTVGRRGIRTFPLERRLETQPATRLVSPVRLTMDPLGRATVAWAGLTPSGQTVVRVADAPPGRLFGLGRDVSPAGVDARPADLVAGPGGRRLVVWVTGSPEGIGSIGAAYGPPPADFGPPETISAGPQARVPRAAFDPRTGRPTVVWSERPPGATRSLARAATR
jgi:hypothetical protein